MTESVDVTVIIVTRDTCALTGTAVRSVLADGPASASEVIVVDNGSNDGTSEVLARDFPSIKVIRSETNLGFARAGNQAARQARGEFLLLLNSDARLQPGTLKSAVAWMRAHPDCAVAGAQLLNADGSRQNSIANFPTLATELLNKSLLRRLFPGRFPGKEQSFAGPVVVETVVGAFMLVRRDVWEKLGGLDERFFFFFEETDFCLRACRAGFRILHLPEVKVWHGQGQSAKQVSGAARIEYWRSRYRYFAKNYSSLTLAFLAAGLWIRLLFDWIAALALRSVTFGRSERWRSRSEVCTALVGWHLRGCPAGAGLPR